MKNFRFTLNLTGSEEVKAEFAEGLIKLGYRDVIKSGRNYDYLSTGDPIDHTQKNMDDFFHQNGAMERDYQFNIDDKAQYEAALAIASIRKEGFHRGEWVVFDGLKSRSHSSSFTIGGLYKLGGKYFSESNISFHVEEDNDGKPNGYHDYQVLFHKASPEEIIAFFKQKYNKMEERKIIGYRLLKDTPSKPEGAKFIYPTTFTANRDGWATEPDGRDNGYTQAVFDAGIGTWFEPIYEEVIKTSTLTLGSRNLVVVINSRGTIRVPDHSTTVELVSIKEILNRLEGIRDIKIDKINGFSSHISKDVQFLRMGCELENNLFSYNELKLVIDTYNELNLTK